MDFGVSVSVTSRDFVMGGTHGRDKGLMGGDQWLIEGGGFQDFPHGGPMGVGGRGVPWSPNTWQPAPPKNVHVTFVLLNKHSKHQLHTQKVVGALVPSNLPKLPMFLVLHKHFVA